MAEIAPFQALRYDFSRLGGNLSTLIAPPYDVLESTEKDRLLAGNGRNVVAVDLPHLPPKSTGPPEVYAQAARRLASWRADGTLVRERNPALYLYHQDFSFAGRRYTRKMFIAGVRLVPFHDGVVLPHEQTFGGPKEDRLALMKATRCQLSPIFGLYADPGSVVTQAFARTADTTPDAEGTLEEVRNRLWVVSDGSVIDRVVQHLRDEKIYIADGHHRYGTALMYRDWLGEQAGGRLPTEHAANGIMFVLASMDDPGCLILPYYRVLGDIDLAGLLEDWRPGIEETSTDRSNLTLWDARTDRTVSVGFTNRAALRGLEPEACRPWYDLDYAYLHRYLIDELLMNRSRREPDIHYVKSKELACRTAREVNGVALLTRATPMAHLRAVSEAGGLMPQKSTYFHPKLATGMTIYELA
ncbi:MAG: DUF1015 domain-containing protein [Planctomycetota bacterium]